MPDNPMFQQWLCVARTLDWTARRRQQSALRAFALLQAAAARAYQASTPHSAMLNGPADRHSEQDTHEGKR